MAGPIPSCPGETRIHPGSVAAKQSLHAMVLLAFAVAAFVADKPRLDHRAEPPVARNWVRVPDLRKELLLVDSVFWEPRDTVSLRRLVREHPDLIKGKHVLEIGTGSGLLALCCAQAGANHVTATDINPYAIRCATWNAANLQVENIEFRLVPSGVGDDYGAFSVIDPSERFDLIISNPPWEADQPEEWRDYALYDPQFQLLGTLLAGFRDHANPRARLLLAYGCVDAVEAVRRLAAEFDLNLTVLDDRDLEALPQVFLPGMLLGLSAKDADEPQAP